MSEFITARYIRLLMFSSMHHRDKVLQSFDELARRCEESRRSGLPGLIYGEEKLYVTFMDYDSGRQVYKMRKSELRYQLFMNIARMKMQTVDRSAEPVVHYVISVDYVKPVRNMLEEWSVKRLGKCYVITYSDPDLASIVLFAGGSRDDVEAAIEALKKLNIAIPLGLGLELGIVQQKLQLIEQEVGKIGWIVVKGVGRGVSYVMMGGESLGSQPEVQDLVQKAREVRALSLRKKIGGESIAVQLGVRATFSVSKKIHVLHFANLIKDLVRKFMELKILVPRAP